jgi:hypothetical protein
VCKKLNIIRQKILDVLYLIYIGGIFMPLNPKHKKLTDLIPKHEVRHLLAAGTVYHPPGFDTDFHLKQDYQFETVLNQASHRGQYSRETITQISQQHEITKTTYESNAKVSNISTLISGKANQAPINIDVYQVKLSKSEKTLVYFGDYKKNAGENLSDGMKIAQKLGVNLMVVDAWDFAIATNPGNDSPMDINRYQLRKWFSRVSSATAIAHLEQNGIKPENTIFFGQSNGIQTLAFTAKESPKATQITFNDTRLPGERFIANSNFFNSYDLRIELLNNPIIRALTKLIVNIFHNKKKEAADHPWQSSAWGIKNRVNAQGIIEITAKKDANFSSICQVIRKQADIPQTNTPQIITKTTSALSKLGNKQNQTTNDKTISSDFLPITTCKDTGQSILYVNEIELNAEQTALITEYLQEKNISPLPKNSAPDPQRGDYIELTENQIDELNTRLKDLASSEEAKEIAAEATPTQSPTLH